MNNFGLPIRVRSDAVTLIHDLAHPVSRERINTRGNANHIVPYGTDPRTRLSRHFVPGYHHLSLRDGKPSPHHCPVTLKHMTNSGTQWVTGKVGEWLQGTDENGDPIVFPFTTTSTPFRTLTAIEPAPNLSIVAQPHSISSKQKTELAVKEMAVTCGFAADCNYRITILNSPPAGKGLGSSSVDIASALLAVKHDRNLDVSETTLFQIMCRVERSDFLFRPEFIVATNPVAGTFSIAGTAPDCVLLAWDTAPGEHIDTEAVRYLDLARRRFSHEYKELCSLMQTNDSAARFHASTRSAELNDQLLPKNGFSVANRLAAEFDALGLVAAHTGTYLGIVFPSSTDAELLATVRAKLVKELPVAPLLFRVGA
jgi:L-threonine kinase